MLNLIRTVFLNGKQYINDPLKAEVNTMFRGFPNIFDGECDKCGECISVCPSNAIKTSPVKIDLGKCTFCGECEKVCSKSCITFTNKHKMAVDKKEKLIIESGRKYERYISNAIEARREINKIFGRSLKLRSVSAGGCNACEMELNACSNVNFDMRRYGVDIVASPKHADGIIITGPITENMVDALNDAYLSTPNPKIVIAMGTCAISGGIFEKSDAVNREFLDKVKVDLYVPGCPVHPLTFINGVLELIRKR